MANTQSIPDPQANPPAPAPWSWGRRLLAWSKDRLGYGPKELVAGLYLVERELPASGMGRVVKARDIRDGSLVALKRPREGASQERFRREANLQTLSFDAGILTPIDVGSRLASEPYFTTRWIDGVSLAGFIRQKASLARRLAVLRECIRLLGSLHQHGMAHRDVKPGNFMVGDDGKVYLLDFGLIHLPDENTLTHSGAVMGTPGYIAPELGGREYANIDFRTADVYSLAAVLWEILVGTVGGGRAGNLSDRLSTPDHRFDALARSGLAADPNSRPATAQEFLAWFDACQKATDTTKPVLSPSGRAPAPLPEPSPRPPKPRRASRWPRMLKAAVVLALLGGGGWLGYPHLPEDWRDWTGKELKKWTGEGIDNETGATGIIPILASTNVTEKLKNASSMILESGTLKIEAGVPEAAAEFYKSASVHLALDGGEWKQINLPWEEKEVSCGSRQVALKVEGFHLAPFQHVYVKEGQITKVRFDLQPAPVQLVVTTQPASNAEIILGARVVGKVGSPIQVAAFTTLRLFARAEYKEGGVDLMPLVPRKNYTCIIPLKDAPLIDSQGMKYLPVPITGGPSAGKVILFSIWETRVQDYSGFAEENVGADHSWLSPGFLQGQDHPVVNVSWNYAVAFCSWKTKKERASGRIGPQDVIRLPTDHEWSCAVGIGNRENAEELPGRKKTIDNVFPWGNQWPPPAIAENLSPSLGVDSIAYTSPVGIFTANPLGLFDLGGNISEVCQDEIRPGERVYRGGSWNNDGEFLDFGGKKTRYYDGTGLLSSNRHVCAPLTLAPNFGFRVVLERASP